MGTAIAVRADFSSQKLRRLATRVRDANQARRLLALAAIRDGKSRAGSRPGVGGMDRQTLRDWVHAVLTSRGPDGLINRNGRLARKPKLTAGNRRRRWRAIVDNGPDPEVDGVVRWRLCVWTCAASSRSASAGRSRTRCRSAVLLKELGFAHVSARPRHSSPARPRRDRDF